MRLALLLFALIIVLPLEASAFCRTRSIPSAGFPRRIKETDTFFSDRMAALEKYMFELEGPEEERAGIRTNSLLVLHQGAVFFERHARGFDIHTPQLAWSITKTITQLLTGVAVANGAVSIDDSICKHLKDAPRDRCVLTVKHLLEHASGIDWNEDYEGAESRQASSVIAMLYGEGKGDMTRFVLEQPFADPPGTAFRYSTGDSTVLGAVVDHAMRPRFGDDYPWKTLFDPIGVKQMTLEVDAEGHHVGGAYSFATVEDWARLGMLMLDDGCWGGQRLLPEGWIAAATTPSEAYVHKRTPEVATEEYGRSVWLNRTIPGVRDQRPFPSAPEDTFMALGHWGQYIIAIPSRDIVIVRSGDDRDEASLDTDRFLKLAMAITGDPL